jgi:hypothetical protein
VRLILVLLKQPDSDDMEHELGEYNQATGSYMLAMIYYKGIQDVVSHCSHNMKS